VIAAADSCFPDGLLVFDTVAVQGHLDTCNRDLGWAGGRPDARTAGSGLGAFGRRRGTTEP
jgi:hypothetical protein